MATLHGTSGICCLQIVGWSRVWAMFRYQRPEKTHPNPSSCPGTASACRANSKSAPATTHASIILHTLPADTFPCHGPPPPTTIRTHPIDSILPWPPRLHLAPSAW
ncbi:hypothetical protein J3E74DRAFT_287284 [Bipolaris maydis]|nr:hypothetical protein J3E74DRAFT_287284 [Bipolaris maydis]